MGWVVVVVVVVGRGGVILLKLSIASGGTVCWVIRGVVLLPGVGPGVGPGVARLSFVVGSFGTGKVSTGGMSIRESFQLTDNVVDCDEFVLLANDDDVEAAGEFPVALPT